MASASRHEKRRAQQPSPDLFSTATSASAAAYSAATSCTAPKWKPIAGSGAGGGLKCAESSLAATDPALPRDGPPPPKCRLISSRRLSENSNNHDPEKPISL